MVRCWLLRIIISEIRQFDQMSVGHCQSNDGYLHFDLLNFQRLH